MNFLWDLFDSFVPNEKNGYKPHFFRVRTVVILAAAILLIGASTFYAQRVIISEGANLAAVLSSVIVELTNAGREDENLSGLSVNQALEHAATLKANDMAAKGYFAHTSPDGTTPWFWFEEAGYPFVYAGENLAVRFTDSSDVVTAWMNSPGHRANILNEHFTEIGIGISEGMFEGKPAIFVVQMFGTPAVPSAPFPREASSAPLAVEVVSLPSDEEDDTPIVSVALETAGTGRAEETIQEASAPAVILEDESFIAVKNEAAPQAAAGNPDVTPAVSLAHTLVTSPISVAEAVYAVLAGLIGIALVVMVIFEARYQHVGNVALGFFLLILMAGFLFAGQILTEPLLIT